MDDLTLHSRDRCTRAGPLVVIGEVLWDVFPDSARLGGAPLNFAVHALRLGLFLAISIGMFNQLSGTNAILYYLNDIFERAGFSRISSDMQAVSIGFTNLMFTCIAMSVIDRLGRK